MKLYSLIKVYAKHERDSEIIELDEENFKEFEHDFGISFDELHDSGIRYIECMDGWTYTLRYKPD